MSKKTKVFLIILFAAAMLVTIYYYRKQEVSESKITEINILISLGGDNTLRAVFERYVQTFNMNNPEVSLIPFYVASDVEAMLKLIYATQANQKYDIACLSANQIYSLHEQNLIEPMDRYLEEDLGMGWMEQLPPVFMAHATMDGQIFSIPFLRNARVALFNQNKVDYNEQRITMEELLEYSQRKFEKQQDNMLLIPLDVIREYIAYQKPYETRGLYEPGKHLNILNNDKIKLIDRIQKGVFQSEILFYRENTTGNKKEFMSGDFGMLITSTLSIDSISSKVDFPIGMAPLMIQEGVTFPLVTSNLYLVKQSDPEECDHAWEAIKILWEIITADEEFQYKDHLPLTAKQLNQYREMEKDEDSLYWKAVSMDYNGYSGMAVSQKSKIDLQIETVLTSIMNRKMDMKQELEQLQQRIDEILK